MKTLSIETIRDFEGDLEFAIADLKSALEDITGVPGETGVFGVHVNADGGVRLDTAGLEDLLNRLADAPGEVAAAFEDFGWKVARALRALRRATVQDALTKALSS